MRLELQLHRDRGLLELGAVHIGIGLDLGEGRPAGERVEIEFATRRLAAVDRGGWG